MRLVSVFFLGLGGSLALLLTGCGGNELGRKPVTGQVTLHGQPLATGTVRFLPESPDGVSSGAAIRSGKYEIPEEKGLPPGSYRVILSAAGAEKSAVDPTAPPGQSTAVATELIPPAYNRQSNVVVEVADDTENCFDFVVP